MWELFTSSVLKQNSVTKLLIHFHLLKFVTRGVTKVGHSAENNGKLFPHFHLTDNARLFGRPPLYVVQSGYVAQINSYGFLQ